MESEPHYIMCEHDCEILFETFHSLMEIFIFNNRQYYKIDSHDKRNLKKIAKKEKELQLIIENLQQKCSYLPIMKQCKDTNHDKLSFKLDHLIQDSKRMINNFLKRKNENIAIINGQLFFNPECDEESIFSTDSEEGNSHKKSKSTLSDIQVNHASQSQHNEKNKIYIIKENNNNNNDNKKNNNNKPNNSIDNTTSHYDDGLKQQEALHDKYNNRGSAEEIDVFTLEEIIENNFKEYEGEKEFRKNLINLNKEVQKYTQILAEEIVKSNEQLDSIADNVKEIDVNVEKANDDLRDAALSRTKFNSVKYPFLLGGIGSSLGLVIPGVGTIIGSSLGALIGMFISKIEKKQIEKIEPSKNKNKK